MIVRCSHPSGRCSFDTDAGWVCDDKETERTLNAGIYAAADKCGWSPDRDVQIAFVQMEQHGGEVIAMEESDKSDESDESDPSDAPGQRTD